MKFVGLFISIIFLLGMGIVVSAPLGEGCIIKYVYYDDSPWEGAYVELHTDPGGSKCCPGKYTDQNGMVSWCDKEYGTYYLYVDWDDDGVWDTVAEMVVLDSEEVVVYNYYYPPTKACGDNNYKLKR